MTDDFVVTSVPCPKHGIPVPKGADCPKCVLEESETVMEDERIRERL
jgi:hypothetical protein